MEGYDSGELYKNLEVDKLRLIDISSEDDFLIDFPSSDSFEGFRLSGAVENKDDSDCFVPFHTANHNEIGNAADTCGQSKQEKTPSESLKAHGPSNNYGECSLRKSLAWDTAFFTNAGVLDPEELFMINKGFRKPKTHLCSEIDEKLWTSTESNCTVSSDGFSFESLDFDLFKDIRASIQNSRKASLVPSSRRISGKKAATKKMEVASRIMMKSIPTSRRQNTSMKGSERITTECNARSREDISSSLKPPKVPGRANSISATPTKRASHGSAVPEHMMASKKPCFRNSSSVTSSSKKSGSSGSTTVSSTVSCSSYDRSSSVTTGKSPFNSLRRKIDSGSVDLAASDSLIRTLRGSIRNKMQLGSSSNSINKSMPNPPSCLSPASSLEGWSSESSSSTSNQRSKISKESMDSSPCKGVLFDSPGSQASDLESHLGNSPVLADISRHFKPSRLRKPSPTIGYFDESNQEKSLVPTLNRLHSTLPKAGAKMSNPGSVVDRTRYEKVPSMRTVTGFCSTKPGSQQTDFPLSPLGVRPGKNSNHQNLENASPEIIRSGIGKMTHSVASRSLGKLSPIMAKQDCLKAKETGTGFHNSSELGVAPSSKMVEKCSRRLSKNQKGTERNRQVQPKCNKFAGNKDGHGYSTKNSGNLAKKEHEVGSQHFLENNQHSFHAIGKENIFRYEDQIDGLSRIFGSIDLNGDVMIEL